MIVIFYSKDTIEYFTSNSTSTNSTISNFDNRNYKVVERFSDKNIAADMLAKLNEFMIQYLKYIKINVININSKNSTHM